MFMCCKNKSWVINLIYSGQLFSYTTIQIYFFSLVQYLRERPELIPDQQINLASDVLGTNSISFCRSVSEGKKYYGLDTRVQTAYNWINFGWRNFFMICASAKKSLGSIVPGIGIMRFLFRKIKKVKKKILFKPNEALEKQSSLARFITIRYFSLCSKMV